MSIEPTVLEQPAQEISSNAPKQHTLKPSEIMALKICSALGALGFTAFMVNSWQMELAAYHADQASQSQTKTAQPAPAASTAPTEMTVTSAPPTTQETPAEMTTESNITDQKVLAQLSQNLYEKIDTNWKQSPTFSKSLVYQVKVAKDGDIAEYESLNLVASEYVKETPLPLLTDAQAPETISPSSLAKFLVVMTPNGGLEVSPWTAEQ
jgi:hypothetical protein